MPRWFVYIALIVFSASLIPLAWIAKSRAELSPNTRIEIFQGMGNQPRYNPQSTSGVYADGRAMRPRPEGVVRRGLLDLPEGVDFDHYYSGQVDGDWAAVLPVEVTERLLARGRERFNIHCAACHGHNGYGEGTVHRRVAELRGPPVPVAGLDGWVQPTSLHTASVLDRPVGHLYNTIKNGIRTMAPYGDQIDVPDRWAIVAYIRALQYSQRADAGALPEGLRPADGE